MKPYCLLNQRHTKTTQFKLTLDIVLGNTF